jgi:hypothetical protein
MGPSDCDHKDELSLAADCTELQTALRSTICGSSIPGLPSTFGFFESLILMHTVHYQNKVPKPSASIQHEHQNHSTKNTSPHNVRISLTHEQVPPAQLILLRTARARGWRPPPRGLKKQARSISLGARKQNPVCS